MRIGIDFDEIITDSLSVIIELHNAKYGTKLKKEDFHSYRFWEIWGGTKEEAVRKVHEFMETDRFAYMSPVAGSLKALRALKESGHELYVITGRPNQLIKTTEHWVEENLPRVFSGIHFANTYSFDGHTRKKSEICKELGIEVLVEDDIDHATECAKAGIKVFLLDYPWNQGVLSKNIERISSWEDILKEVSLANE